MGLIHGGAYFRNFTVFSTKQKKSPIAKINSRKTFVSHGTPTQLVLCRPSIIMIIYLQSQFKQFNETRWLGWCPRWECRFRRVTCYLFFSYALSCLFWKNSRFHTIHYFYLVQVLWQPSIYLLVSSLCITRSVRVEPGILILSPLVTAIIGLQRSEKCLKGIEKCERRRNQCQKNRPNVGTEHEEINTNSGQTKQESDL